MSTTLAQLLEQCDVAEKEYNRLFRDMMMTEAVILAAKKEWQDAKRRYYAAVDDELDIKNRSSTESLVSAS